MAYRWGDIPCTHFGLTFEEGFTHYYPVDYKDNLDKAIRVAKKERDAHWARYECVVYLCDDENTPDFTNKIYNTTTDYPYLAENDG